MQECRRGDRLGICVTQLDAKLIERGLACAPGKSLPGMLALASCAVSAAACLGIRVVTMTRCAAAGSVPTFEAAVALVEKIRFHAGEVRSHTKMHVTVGHSTGAAMLCCEHGLVQREAGWAC